MTLKSKILTWVGVILFSFLNNSCKVVDRANRHFEYFEYAKAIPEFRKALKSDSTNVETWAKLGDCYRMNSQTVEAEECYRKAVTSPGMKSIYKLYCAQMMMSNGKYEDARMLLDQYIVAEPNDPRGPSMKQGIDHLADLYADQDHYKIQRLNLNTSCAEFSPVLYKDGIIFTSSREGDKWSNRNTSWTNENYYSLYYAKGKETMFDAPVLFLKDVQTKYNNSSVCFSANGQEMILTRNNIENKKVRTSNDKIVKLKLQSSVYKDGQWAAVIPFQYNSDQYSCAHPALSPDGSKFYFTSDMPGSIGGMDLWVCTRNGDGWSNPKNLGPSVNTKGNEIFPTVDADGTIYFSSNGRDGIGGLDIYSTTETGDTYSTPKNAGAPVNSPDDDFGLVWDHKNNIGYFSSNRTGKGNNDDIFCMTPNTVKMNVLVYDKNTGIPLEQSNVNIIEGEMPMAPEQTKKDGRFTITAHLDKSYQLMAYHTGYKMDTLNLASSEMSGSGDTMFVKMPLEKADLVIAIEGRIYNETTGNPVDSARVTLVNFTRPDTMRMITTTDGHYAFSNLSADCRYRVVAETDFCVPNTADTSTKGIVESTTLVLNIGLYCLSDNIVLRNIYYDLDKYNIRPDAARELDKLVELLRKYPTIKIELGSHTDCRASYAYNMTLSNNRAKSAVAYLASHGIDKRRMIAHGYGETRLVNRCECEGDRKVECTEAEHQMNRRTEINIISWNWNTAVVRQE